MKRRESLEFRTPQHPSSGTNNWGGASPLLAREIPQESLELRYLRLNSVRSGEIFPGVDDDDHEYKYSVQTYALQYKEPATPSCKTKRFYEAVSTPSRIFKRFSEGPSRPSRTLERFLSKFNSQPKQQAALGRNSKKKRRFGIPRLDPQSRWPNGWC